MGPEALYGDIVGIKIARKDLVCAKVGGFPNLRQFSWQNLLKVAIWNSLPHLTGDCEALTQPEAIFAEP